MKEKLKKSNEELEQLVAECSTELEQVKRQLQQEISERKRLEKALRESQEQFKALYTRIPIPTYTWQWLGKDCILVDYNEAAEAFTEGPIVEYLGKTTQKLLGDEPEILEAISRCYTEKTTIKKEVISQIGGGKGKHLTVNCVFVPPNLVILQSFFPEDKECCATLRNYRQDDIFFWNELQIAPLHNILEDITERRQAEEALRESQERLDSILSSLEDVVWSTSLENCQYLYINAAAEGVYGRNLSEFFHNPNLWLEVVHPEDRKRVERTSQTLVEKGISKDLEYRILRPDGEERWIRDRAHLIYDATGTAIRIDGIATDITYRVRAEEALKKSEEQFRLTFELAPIGMAIATLDGKFLRVNQALRDTLGYKVEELLEQTCADITHPDDLPAELTLCQKLLQGEIPYFQKEKRFLTKDSKVVNAILQVAPIADSQGEPLHLIGQVVDITKRKQAEQALQESEQRLEGILSSIEDVVWSASAITFEILYLNPATEKVYGRPVSEFFKNPNLWFEVINPEDRELMRQHIEVLMEKGSTEIKYRIVRPNGEVRWLYSRSRLVCDADGKAIRIDGTNTDITEHKRAEEKLRHNAFYDSLTDLPNRALFIDRLEHALQRTKRRGDYIFAVLFLDFDDFKVVNDSLGHMAGDQLLKVIARRLEGCLRPSDTLARLGGDEFTILLENIKDLKDATRVAQRIHKELTSPFNLNGHEVFANTSIGIVLSRGGFIKHTGSHSQTEPGNEGNSAKKPSSTDYEQPEELLRDSDIAMYRAKALGKGHYAVFNQKMHELAVARLQLETDLRRAIEHQEFLVYYQPIVSLITGRLTAFEALIRWQHPDRGLVLPAKFIPVAEETGLIVPIGQWVLSEACRQLHTWQAKFPAQMPLKISVNLSGKQLREEDLIEQIDKILIQTGLDGRSLKLEITESMLIENVEGATKMLWQLRARNIELCLDEFGTGYSSLSYLHLFPVHTLKIDRSFVSQMKPDDEKEKIVRAIVTLASTLGIDAIAEGVETEQQLAQLKLLGCEQAQGYFFSKPLDKEAAEELISQSPQW
ncbi:MAG: EAL domain-containing protein [Xenococcaceae cyanobacterium]